MENQLKKYRIDTEQHRGLFNSQIEWIIREFAKRNNLLLPEHFDRRHYEYYWQASPWKIEIEYSIVFYAYEKSADDMLREQIEFQIKQLET